jgi:membrane-associated phospholipid phosphatase
MNPRSRSHAAGRWQRSVCLAVGGQKGLCAAAALLVLAWKLASAPGGVKGHLPELSACGVVFALITTVWACRCAGREALGVGGAAAAEGDRRSARRSAMAALLFFDAFLALGVATRLSPVQTFDLQFLRVAHGFGAGPSPALRAISDSGGPGLLYLLPLLGVTLCLVGRARSLAFLAAVLFGSEVIGLLFKEIIERPRPGPFVEGRCDSYPSAHVMIATVLAVGLVMTGPSGVCRAWQQSLLWGAAISWPVLMAVARIHLGCHFLTDVLGGMLLGAAWICLCRALLLALTSPPGTALARKPRSSDASQ